MKRIALLHEYWAKPTPTDFKAKNTKILITPFLTMYVLHNDKTISAIDYSEMNNLINTHHLGTNFENLLCTYIENLPIKSWDQIAQSLAL